MPAKMPAKKTLVSNLVGAWAFLIGVILAIVLGAFTAELSSGIAITLAVLGLIVGLFNIGDKEVTPFLFAAVALVIVSYFGTGYLAAISGVEWLSRIFGALMILFVPATVIVALKQVFSLART